MSVFTAIDFETADYGRDSACAVGLVRVENNKIVRSETHLIRPPRQTFIFTEIHGLTWADVKDAPTFKQLWHKLDGFFKGAEFLAAHNASFDEGVLNACARAGCARSSPSGQAGLNVLKIPRQTFPRSPPPEHSSTTTTPSRTPWPARR